MSERIWNPLIPCVKEEPSFEFSDPFEHDQERAYELIMDTIIGVSIHMTLAHDENKEFIYLEEGEPVFDDCPTINQCFIKLPIEYGEWEDEEPADY